MGLDVMALVADGGRVETTEQQQQQWRTALPTGESRPTRVADTSQHQFPSASYL